MARGRKKESALTPEEKLAQALVPDWEQPYKVPKNWCWTTVGNVCSFVGGGTPDKANPAYWNGDIPWASVKDIKGSRLVDTIDRITQNGLENSSANLCQKDELILVTRIEPGKSIISEIVTAINQDLKVVKSLLPSEFLYYYFQTFQHKFEEKASGSTVKGITIPNVQGTEIPVPPLAEQRRIVDRIEYLFVKLDEAKEKAQSVLDSFETRKAAILHKAFTGKLTEEWRTEHGVELTSWKKLSVSEIGDVITGSTPDTKKPEYYGGSVPFVKPTELNQGRCVSISADTLTEAGRDVSRPVRAGSTCVCCIGATIGKCGFLVVDAVTNQQINTIVPHPFMEDAFVYYYCISDRFKNTLISNSSSTTLPIINKKKMSALEFVVPPKSEQAEIVCILDSLFAKEQQAKEAAEAVLEKIDLLKKSILARAFRGELGTNDPTEESALELLKQVLR